MTRHIALPRTKMCTLWGLRPLPHSGIRLLRLSPSPAVRCVSHVTCGLPSTQLGVLFVFALILPPQRIPLGLEIQPVLSVLERSLAIRASHLCSHTIGICQSRNHREDEQEETEHLSFRCISESSECWRNQYSPYQLTFTITSSNEERNRDNEECQRTFLPSPTVIRIKSLSFFLFTVLRK